MTTANLSTNPAAQPISPEFAAILSLYYSALDAESAASQALADATSPAEDAAGERVWSAAYASSRASLDAVLSYRPVTPLELARKVKAMIAWDGWDERMYRVVMCDAAALGGEPIEP